MSSIQKVQTEEKTLVASSRTIKASTTEKTIDGTAREIINTTEMTVTTSLSKRRITEFDLFSMIFEILRLMIKEFQFINDMRKQELLEQLSNMEEVVKQWRDQGRWLLFTGIGAGFIGIVGGALPIIGHMKGDTIMGALKRVFSSLEGMKTHKFFDAGSKICQAMSGMYDATGKVHNAYSEGHKARFQFQQETARTKADEEMRRREEMNQNFREFRNFIKEILDQINEATRQLLSI